MLFRSVAAKAVIVKHSKDFNGTLDDPEVIKLCGISRNTYYKYKRQLKAEQQSAMPHHDLEQEDRNQCQHLYPCGQCADYM